MAASRSRAKAVVDLVRQQIPWWSALVGALALLITGGIHLWLYLDQGYRDIPTIRYLFLLMVITAGVLAALILTAHLVVVSLLATGFLISVLGGYVLSASVGLFGFTETGEVGAAWAAGVAEVGGAAVLAAGALMSWRLRDDPVGKSSSRKASVSN
jgi:hypothetical protein